VLCGKSVYVSLAVGASVWSTHCILTHTGISFF